MWKEIATAVEEIYGSFVNYEERFFICPECGEPIYEADWQDEDFERCPICEFEWDI